MFQSLLLFYCNVVAILTDSTARGHYYDFDFLHTHSFPWTLHHFSHFLSVLCIHLPYIVRTRKVVSFINYHISETKVDTR